MFLTEGDKGLVVKKFNNYFHVDLFVNSKLKPSIRLLCKCRKNIYYQNNLIVVGDKVNIGAIDIKQKTAIIENLIPRKNLIKRPAVANVTDIYIVH